MAGVGGEVEEVLAWDDTQATLHLDQLMGHIQDILLSEEFSAVRESFMLEHCGHFEDREENKLEYTEIFTKYTRLMEAHLEAALAGLDGGVSLAWLQQAVREGQCHDGEVLDLLLTLTDFNNFKNSMLETKKSQEEGCTMLQDILQVTKLGS